jgi:hypothetical protein
MKTQRTPEELKKAIAVLKRGEARANRCHYTELGAVVYQALSNVKTNSDLEKLMAYKNTYVGTQEVSVKKACIDCIQFEFIDLYK